MNILWFFDKQLDVSTSKSARIEIIRYLQKDHEVFLVTGYRYSKMQFEELRNEIVYLDSSNLPFINRFLFYREQIKQFPVLLQKYQPDVILFNTMNLNLMRKAVNYKSDYNCKLFLDIRTLPVSSNQIRNNIDYYLFSRSIKYAARKLQGISYITPGMAKYCKQHYSLPAHPSTIWSSGVNLEKFVPFDSIDSDKTLKLIYHGTLARNRGLDELIRAIARIKELDITVNFIGEGDGVSELKELTNNLGLHSKVKFLGVKPFKEMPIHINNADIGVLPFPDYAGWNTSSPIKLFEYLACAKPVILTKIPAHLNVLDDKEFAFWAQDSSPENLSKAILNAYNAKSLFSSLGKKAREFVSSTFSWKQQAQKLEDFIIIN